MKKEILLSYLENLFTESDIIELKECLHQDDIVLEGKKQKPLYLNGIEELFSQIQIILSPELVYAISTGICTNGMYDVLKEFLIKIYFKIKNVLITKMHSGGKSEKVSPTIHFIIGETKVVLPTDMDEEKYKYFVDKFFESIKSEGVEKKEYCIWNEGKGEIEYYSKQEIVRKIYLERNNKD